MQMPPSSAPSMLPMPPSTTMTKAISTKLSPTVGNTENSGIITQAASPTSAEPPAKVIRKMRGTGMPISIAASPSCTVARIALPR